MKTAALQLLAQHYERLYLNARQQLLAGNQSLDPRIDDPTDKRLGITLLIRPSAQVKSQIQAFLAELKAIAPQQYYYPSSDIHITVLSIISCYQGFDLKTIRLPAYVELIQKSISSQANTDIRFKGITASSAGVMVQGFPSGDFLQETRDSLRRHFKASGLQQSIDTRYAIQTAHCTVVRFREPLIRKQAFVEMLDRYRAHDFGTCRVEALELVHNDWYQRESRVKKLHVFKPG